MICAAPSSVPRPGSGANLTSCQNTAKQIWNAGSAVSPASTTFTGVLPDIPVNRNTSDPIKVTYIFDQVMANKVGSIFRQDTLSTTWNFELLDEDGLPTGITGTCGTGVFDNQLVEQHN